MSLVARRIANEVSFVTWISHARHSTSQANDIACVLKISHTCSGMQTTNASMSLPMMVCKKEALW